MAGQVRIGRMQKRRYMDSAHGLIALLGSREVAQLDDFGLQSTFGSASVFPSRTKLSSGSVATRRLRPSNRAPSSIANDIWRISPSTLDEACKETLFARMTPVILPRTSTCSPTTVPVTLPCSPTIISGACTSPSISPSIWSIPLLMIFSAVPTIFRSMEITDLVLSTGTRAWGCRPLVRGAGSVSGLAEELRVSIKCPVDADSGLRAITRPTRQSCQDTNARMRAIFRTGCENVTRRSCSRFVGFIVASGSGLTPE